ncbi:hypothetical protein Brsp05_04489 [Brucella sp. NBRC 12953]
MKHFMGIGGGREGHMDAGACLKIKIGAECQGFA